MKILWISITVFLLDQFTKYAIHKNQLADSITFINGELALIILQNSGITAQQIKGAMLDSTSWMLAGGLITLPLLISRWNSHFHFITFRAALGLQLTAGGILSYTFDYILRDNIQNSLELRLFETFSLKTGVADLALITGFLLLVYVLFIGSSHIKSRFSLIRATPSDLNLSPLSRGVDNIHIDVHLSPEFCHSTTLVLRRLVDLVLDSIQQNKSVPTLTGNPFKSVQKSFLFLHQEALHKAKGSGEPQVVDLFYAALLKFIHAEVASCVATKIRQAKETIQNHHKRGIGSSDGNRYVEELFRQQDIIIARINQLMVNGLIENRMPSLNKSIKSILGKKQSFAMDVISSPLVISNGADIEPIQFNHYLLFGHGKYRAMNFIEFDRVLDSLLHDYLTLIPAEKDDSGKTGNSDHSANLNTSENLSRPSSVLMHPTNITILFDQQWSKDKIAKNSRFKQWRKHLKYKAQLRFQKRLAGRVTQSLEKAGLAQWIIAVYEARTILNRVNVEISPLFLVSLLLESESKKDLKQRINQNRNGAATQTLSTKIIDSWEAMRKQKNGLLEQHLFNFIDDFSRYRRDLKTLYRYHNSIGEIEILLDNKSIQTSRSNFTLYEFLLPQEKSNELAEISSHIIIKADLRGSTEVTDRLNQLALNPATHFDRNFFSPINEVINDFGAEKVFIEGDAIILIINDYAGTQQHRTASRACALAASILRIVAKQNKELTCYGLPELELGIGIAYSNESPRFLFDGDHKITISPAINRADRLSACTWSIRNWRERLKAPVTQVEVYQPSEQALGHGEKAQKDMVYNLNGILIESQVFELLQKELSPKRIKNNLPDKQDSQLYAIKVPEAEDEFSSLIIRKSPVKVYDPEYRLDECPPVEGRYFYEVIHDRGILNTLRKRAATTST